MIQEPTPKADAKMVAVANGQRIIRELTKAKYRLPIAAAEPHEVMVVEEEEEVKQEVNLDVDLDNQKAVDVMIEGIVLKATILQTQLAKLKQALWNKEAEIAEFLRAVHDKLARHKSGHWGKVEALLQKKKIFGKNKTMTYVRLGELLASYPVFGRINWDKCETVTISELRNNAGYIHTFLDEQKQKPADQQDEVAKNFPASIEPVGQLE